MNNIKEFSEHPMSRKEFWTATLPVTGAILLLTTLIITWKRLYSKELRSRFRKKLWLFLDWLHLYN